MNKKTMKPLYHLGSFVLATLFLSACGQEPLVATDAAQTSALCQSNCNATSGGGTGGSTGSGSGGSTGTPAYSFPIELVGNTASYSPVFTTDTILEFRISSANYGFWQSIGTSLSNYFDCVGYDVAVTNTSGTVIGGGHTSGILKAAQWNIFSSFACMGAPRKSAIFSFYPSGNQSYKIKVYNQQESNNCQTNFVGCPMQSQHIYRQSSAILEVRTNGRVFVD